MERWDLVGLEMVNLVGLRELAFVQPERKVNDRAAIAEAVAPLEPPNFHNSRKHQPQLHHTTVATTHKLDSLALNTVNSEILPDHHIAQTEAPNSDDQATTHIINYHTTKTSRDVTV